MEKYEFVKDIGPGRLGVAKVMRNRKTKELVAMTLIERDKIDEYVRREISNHMSLMHPNIVSFIELLLTPFHLGIVMEYAAGGKLSEYVTELEGRFSEDEARYLFQQLISGVSYCHSMELSQRLKLENTLLDESPTPRLKICDFGYSGSFVFNLTGITRAYMAPELVYGGDDVKLTDVWSCGVTLYVMLVGAYPFDDHEQEEDKDFWMLQRIMGAKYEIPDHVQISKDCRDLLSRIFVVETGRRITIKNIMNHPWFLKNLPHELTESNQARHYRKTDLKFPLQSMEEMMIILREATPPTLDTLPVSADIGLLQEEKDDDPTMSDVHLPEKPIKPNRLSRYLNSSAFQLRDARYLNSSAFQLRDAASNSIEFDSQHSTRAVSTYDPTMSDVRLPERSIIDRNRLHSIEFGSQHPTRAVSTYDPKISDVRLPERSIVNRNGVRSIEFDSKHSTRALSTYDPTISDVRLPERSISDRHGLHSWYLNPTASQLQAASSFVDSKDLDSSYSTQTKTLFKKISTYFWKTSLTKQGLNVSMSDLRPADRSRRRGCLAGPYKCLRLISRKKCNK